MKTNLLLILFLGLSFQVFSQLGVPSLSSPANGATYFVGSSINFSWTSVTDAISYDVEFDTGTGYTYLTNITGTGMSMQLVASNAGTHTWHVRARNATSIGLWSPSQNYIVIGIPGVPTTVSPATESILNYNTSTNFTWNAVTNATGYKIQFDFDPPIVVAGTSYPNSFTSIGNHSWKVLASNPAGESAWSLSKNFSVVLGIPSPTSPANTLTTYVGSTIVFSWTPAGGATSYDIEFDPGFGYTTLTNVTGTSMNLLLTAATVGQHAWHVRAKNGSTNGTWSLFRSYTVVGIPAVPTTNNPASGSSVNYNSSVNFNWNAVPNATSYQIQFDAESPITVTGTNYTKTFSTLGNHIWKVLASNDAGDSGWSTVKTFAVVIAAPPLISPTNGSTSYIGTNLGFSWTAVPGATSYDIEFDAGLGSASLTNVPSVSYQKALIAAYVGSHTWQVRANNGTTNGQWSQPRTFIVAGIPGIPTTINPAAEASVTYEIASNFTWNSVLYATSYQIQFDSESPLTVINNSYSRTFSTLGSHSWKVKAINAAGESSWSNASNFTVVLGIPTLSSPANNSSSYVGSTASFSWSSVAGATSYDLEFDSGLGTVTLSNVTGISTNVALIPTHAGIHTWHVRAKNGSTDGAWSATRNFTVIGIPLAPTTTSPVNGANIYYDAATSFTWNASQNATSYRIQFDLETPITVSGTSYTRTFSSFGSHTWKVYASNDAGDSGWSSIKTFTVVLGVPTLSAPANTSTAYINTTLNFTWTSVAGATSYDIEFDAGQGSASLSNVAITSKQWALVSASVGNHTWHVRARNGSNFGQWSTTRNFIVAGIPDIPVTINPPAEGTVPYSALGVFAWNAVQNATSYLIQFDSEAPISVTGTIFPRTFNTMVSHTWKVKAVNPAGESDWSTVKNFTVALGTPNLTSPTNASVEYVGSTLEFSWTSVAGATSYDIEFDSGLGYAYLTNVSVTSFNMPLTISNVGPHTWHVRAKLNTTIGSWSASRSYTVAGIPTVPVTINPASGSSVTSEQNVTFTWNGVATATSYKIQFDSEAPIVVSGTSYSRSFSTLGNHTWKVLASNDAGDSTWSSDKLFSVELGVPTLTSPANASNYYVGSTINFSWTPVTGATSYDIEFDAGMGYGSLTNVTSASLNLVLTNILAGPHTWHVRAKTSTSTGSWSLSRTYQVFGIPSAPVLITPLDLSSVLYDTPVNFTWSTVTTATGYQIQFDSETPITVSGTSYRRSFTTQGNHTWKVLATNASGNSSWSNVNTFTMILGVPSLTTPIEAVSFNVGTTISFTWTSVTGATSYDVELDSGTGIVSLSNVSGASMNLAATVSNAGSHTWHVRARLNNTAGEWSSSRSFTILTIPSIPVLVSPAGGAVITYNTLTNFSWNTISGATGYKIQFDNEAPVTVTGNTYAISFNTLGLHNWKVLAFNGAGESSWSSVGVLNVDLAIPTLLSPVNAFTYFVGSTISFSWTPVPGVTSYDVEFDSGMQTVSLSNVTGTTLNILMDATSAGIHTWHVRGKLNSTNGQYSATQSYSVMGLPSVPILTGPVNGSTVYVETITNFTWNAVSNATGYLIQFDAEAPIIVSGTSYSRAFNTMGNHSWKVLATNAAGNSSWSNVNIITMALGVPSLTAPTDAAVFNVGSTISFTWTSVIGATSYDVELDSGTGIVSLSNVTGTSMNLAATVGNVGLHTWHVRARLSTSTGEWSSSRTYTIFTVPSIPVLVSPADGSVTTYNTLTNFSWNMISGATGYKIQFDNEAPVTVTGNTYARSFNTLGLHNWKVLAFNSAGESSWSSVGILNVELAIPTLLSPVNAFTYFVGANINFSWTSVPGATSYDVEFDAGMQTVSLSNVTGTSLNILMNATSSGIHTWHVRAKLNSTNGQYSASQSYSVLSVPIVPALTVPANGSTVYSETLTNFTWNAVGNATGYLIQFDAEVPIIVSGTNYSRTFDTLGNHSWKVLATNAAGNSDWSTAKTFTVAAGIPVLKTRVLSVTPDNSWDFGLVTLTNTNFKTFILQNTGNTAINISNLTLIGSNADQFNISNPTVTAFDIVSGGTLMVTVNFKPTSSGSKSVSLTIVCNADNVSSSKAILLSGTGTLLPTKTLTVNPDILLDYENVILNTISDKTLTVKNNGTSTMSVTGITLSGINSDQYTIISPTITSFDLPADGNQQITVRFKPTSTGIKSAILTLTNNSDNASPSKLITISGTGFAQQGITIPVVSTNPFSGIASTSATGGGLVSSDGGAPVTTKGLCWSKIENPSIIDSKTVDGTGIGSYISNLTGLSPGTNYHARAYATNSVGTSYGADIQFTTPSLATVITVPASSVTSSSATSGGNVTSDGGSNVISKGLCWSIKENPTISDSKTTDGADTGSFTSYISGLNVGTTYHARAYATNAVGTSYGADIQFTTSSLATVITLPASSVTSLSAASGGNVTSDGGSNVISKGLCWSLKENPTISDSKTVDGTGVGVFTSNISGLIVGTTYHARAYATNSVGTSYGADVIFTTPAPATVVTVSAIAASSTTAIGKGDVTSDGGSPVLQKGFCWSISANPTIADAKTVNGTGIGSFSDMLTGLKQGSTYHVRAYATNSVGTSYGTDILFATPALASVVTVSATASDNSSKTAMGKGNVTSDGGAVVTEKGFCWSTSDNPTIGDSRTTDGTGIGTFSDIISGLTPGTTYHIRAYAINAVGTSYGADLTFETTVNNGVFNISSFYHIYPNPTHGRIKIRVMENVPVDMSIYSFEGKLLETKKLLSRENIIDLNLENGIYIIDLKSEKAKGTYKLVIQ